MTATTRRRLAEHASAPEPLWTIDETSGFLGVPVPTLRNYRTANAGPRSFKVGRHVRYRPADVIAWLERQQTRGESA